MSGTSVLIWLFLLILGVTWLTLEIRPAASPLDLFTSLYLAALAYFVLLAVTYILHK